MEKNESSVLAIKVKRNKVHAGTPKEQFSFHTGNPVNKNKIRISPLLLPSRVYMLLLITALYNY